MPSEKRNLFDEWSIDHVLGEGSYGQVYLLVSKKNDQRYIAMKVLNREKLEFENQDARKEISIHKLLKHSSIISFYGFQCDKVYYYIFLEYASGGELFDRIEPDVGMEFTVAHSYYRQIIGAVEYMHEVGVTHRDLKPENILLDHNDVIKISDFGLATIFLYKGVERKLEKRCGTLQYVAPEVLKPSSYSAKPADIWSTIIILVAMLTGELPWDKPSFECPDYVQWINGKTLKAPWSKLNIFTLSFLRKILVEDPLKRLSISQIKESRWFTNIPHSNNRKRKNSSETECHSSFASSTQPDPSINNSKNTSLYLTDCSNPVSFSQPSCLDELIINSQQLLLSQSNKQNLLQKMVKRMTRLMAKTSMATTKSEVIAVLEEFGFVYKSAELGWIVSTIDKRKSKLTFLISLIEMSSEILIDFRLSKGDGIEFKKCFVKIKDQLSHIINKSARV